MIFFAWILFSILVGVLGSKYGRFGFGYFLLSLVISPLIAWIILLCVGKTTKAKAKEVMAMKRQLELLEKAGK